jgi:hypothetical protein
VSTGASLATFRRVAFLPTLWQNAELTCLRCAFHRLLRLNRCDGLRIHRRAPRRLPIVGALVGLPGDQRTLPASLARL